MTETGWDWDEPAVPDALEWAARAWEERGDPRGLIGWLRREVGPEGIPPRQAVEAWWPCLERFEAARRRRPEGWLGAIDARLEPFVRAALRFSRPDGSAVFGPRGAPPGRRETIRARVARLSDPGLETVANWWFPLAEPLPRNRKRPAPPPLPAVADDPRPLAMLRADWTRRGDWLAFDQREEGCRVELAGGGSRWLGPRWASPPEAGPARLVRWTTGPEADVAEWSFRAGPLRVTRTAVLLRGRRMALLAEECVAADRVGPCALELELAPGVSARSTLPGRAWRLEGRSRAAAEVIPLGLAASAGPPMGSASFRAEASRLHLQGLPNGRRVWLPLVFSWDPARSRRGAFWRTLTVTQKTRPCGPDVAFAARVAWSPRRDSLLVYRSLASPALRCFLGHSTSARFLVAIFTSEGDVKPLVSVEE